MSFLERTSLDWSSDSIRLINTPSQKAKSIYYYMQEAGYFKTKPPYFTERSGLPSFLILFTISGQGLLQYEGSEYSLNSNTCFFINCMEHHTYCTKDTGENSGWEFLWVHFYGNSSLGYYQEYTRNGFGISTIQDSFTFDTILRRIIAVNQKKQLDCEILTSKLLTDLLTELCIVQVYKKPEVSLKPSSTYFVPSYVTATAKYIDLHFQDDLSLDSLAAHCNISKYHLSHEFNRYMDLTVNEYLISTRISHAKELLKYTNEPIAEITFGCGMHNVSHFINLFKAREGMTPLVYRQSWGE